MTNREDRQQQYIDELQCLHPAKDWKAEYECCWRDCELWHARAEAAESQLASMVPAIMHEELRQVMLGERRAKETAADDKLRQRVEYWREHCQSAESTLTAVRALCESGMATASYGERGMYIDRIRSLLSATPPVPTLAERTKEEQAVLDACALLKPRSLEFWAEFGNTVELKAVAVAVRAWLARRESKGGGK